MQTEAIKTPKQRELDFVWTIFVTAFESGVHGIGCSFEIIHYRHCNDTGKQRANAKVRELEEDGEPVHKVTLNTIRKGLDVIEGSDWSKEADKGMHVSYRAAALICRKALDTGIGNFEIDGPIADMIVQCGLFGEVKYS